MIGFFLKNLSLKPDFPEKENKEDRVIIVFYKFIFPFKPLHPTLPHLNPFFLCKFLF